MSSSWLKPTFLPNELSEAHAIDNDANETVLYVLYLY
jgi:hypothetical protein